MRSQSPSGTNSLPMPARVRSVLRLSSNRTQRSSVRYSKRRENTTMELRVVEEGGVKGVEGQPGAPFMSSTEDTGRVLEACFSSRADAALLYADNLTDAFFDLSSGQAGATLQRLRSYRVRLAVVCPPGTVQLSSRFGEMVAEESRGRDFGLFETRRAAREWLERS